LLKVRYQEINGTDLIVGKGSLFAGEITKTLPFQAAALDKISSIRF
jgi:hypothetical protein